jgi:sulfoxide reductase heme-binding subunit YedZ
VYLIAASAALVAMCGAILAIYGWNQDALALLVRATARTSLACFLAAYLASPLRMFIRNDLTRWLLENRRYSGLSYAVSHSLHLAAIVALAGTSSSFEVGPVAIVFGSTAYVLLYAMAFTSTDRAVAALGIRRWKALHRTGMHYNWFIFAQSYVGRAVLGDPAYVGLTAVVVGSGLLRAAAFARRRSNRPG